ncbi:MAG: protein kinase [Planctomycetota bacterium]|nr:protein kinase [Planctomycetota bacterium]
MADENRCPKCGARLPTDAPEGLCPKCLMKGVISKEDADVTLESPHIEGPGTMIGRYKLLELIGEGGMGLVYLAEQQEPIRRRAALKIVKLGMDTKQVIAHFEAEKQMLALLDHPNIARVYDAGTTETGRPYFVMEYVKGQSITEYCDQHKSSIEERLKLFRQVCEGVQYAHQKGIIHRDIKPSNILVSIQGDRAVPKIIDFGIAKAVTQPLTERTLFTEQGQLLGTPEYMSPEQVDMATQDIDTRSDIYSLGVVLYQLLAGVLPFGRELYEKGGFAEIQRIIQEVDPPNPSTALSKLGDEAKKIAEKRKTQVVPLARRLHRELEWIPLKAMRKERVRRYRSASELADDIQNYLNGNPLIAGPETAIYRVKKFVRRHAGSVATFALVAAAIILGLVISTAMYFRSERALKREAVARTQAEKAENVAQEQREIAEQKAEDLRRSLYFNCIALAQAEWLDGNIGHVYKLLALCSKNLRRWEWYRLWHISDEAANTFWGHQGWVLSVALSPDGKRIISGSEDGMIKVWDAATGIQMMTLCGHESFVNCVAVSLDGKRIVSGSKDGTIKVWDAETGSKVMTLRGHGRGELGGSVCCVAYSSDGKRIISGGDDQTLKVWDVEKGSELITLRIQESNVRSVAFSHDGKRIVSVGNLGVGHLKVWNAETGQEQISLDPNTKDLHFLNVAFSSDGKHIASVHSSKGTVKIWDAETGSEVLTLHGHRSFIQSVAFSPDGRYILAGCVNGTLKIWEVADGREIIVLRGHMDSVESVAFSPDGKRIVSGSRDRTVKVWDLEAPSHVRTLHGPKGWTSCVAFSPDGKRIVSGGSDDDIGKIKVWDAASGTELITTAKAHENGVSAVTFSPDGKCIASGGWDKTVKLWDAETGLEVMTLRGHRDGVVRSMTFSLDNRQLISWSLDDTVKMWDIKTGAEMKTLRGNENQDLVGTMAAFSPDGKKIALGFYFWVKIREMATGHEIMTLYGHNGTVTSLLFSPDGKRIVSGSADSTIKVWDAETGLEVMTLRGHQGPVSSIAFSPDGKRIVSGGSDGTVKVWDVETGAELTTLRGHESDVTSISFSPDGKRIVSESEDGTINLYDSASPPEEKVMAYSIWVYVEAGKLEEAAKLVKELRPSTPQKDSETARLVHNVIGMLAWAYYNRGETKERSGKVAEAIGDYEAAIRLNPNNAYVFNSLAWLQEAKVARDRVRSLLKDEWFARDDKAKAFLAEAEKLIEGKE